MAGEPSGTGRQDSQGLLPPPLFWIFEALTLGFPLENVFILPNLGRVPPPGLVGTFFREP